MKPGSPDWVWVTVLTLTLGVCGIALACAWVGCAPTQWAKQPDSGYQTATVRPGFDASVGP